MTQKSSLCCSQWHLKLLIANTTDPNGKYTVNVYHHVLQRLVECCNIELDLSTCSESDITSEILEIDSIYVEVDLGSKKLVDVE